VCNVLAAASSGTDHAGSCRETHHVARYSAYPDEIEDEISQADEESRAAEAAWLAEQRLLA